MIKQLKDIIERIERLNRTTIISKREGEVIKYTRRETWKRLNPIEYDGTKKETSNNKKYTTRT